MREVCYSERGVIYIERGVLEREREGGGGLESEREMC